MNGATPVDRSRWDNLDAALAQLRACRDIQDLADRACTLAIAGCGAQAVALGRIAGGVWTPWLKAGQGRLFDVGETLPSRPISLAEAPTLEQQVLASRRSATRGPFQVLGGAMVVVAAVAAPAHLLGVLHVVTATASCPEIVETYASTLGSMLALIAVQQRAEEQTYALERLLNGIAELPERPLELLGTALDPPNTATTTQTSTTGLRERLTARQREVLELMQRGLSNTEIAERLVLTVPTVKSHVRAVLRASGAVNRPDALARFARESDRAPFSSHSAI